MLSIGRHVKFDTHASKFCRVRQKFFGRPACVKTLVAFEHATIRDAPSVNPGGARRRDRPQQWRLD